MVSKLAFLTKFTDVIARDNSSWHIKSLRTIQDSLHLWKNEKKKTIQFQIISIVMPALTFKIESAMESSFW